MHPRAHRRNPPCAGKRQPEDRVIRPTCSPHEPYEPAPPFPWNGGTSNAGCGGSQPALFASELRNPLVGRYGAVGRTCCALTPRAQPGTQLLRYYQFDLHLVGVFWQNKAKRACTPVASDSCKCDLLHRYFHGSGKEILFARLVAQGLNKTKTA